MTITFSPSSSFAVRKTMGEVRKGDLLHIEDADGSFRQMIVTRADRKGAMVTFAAEMTNPDYVRVADLTVDEYRALSSAEKAAWRDERDAATEANRRMHWSASTHRASNPVAKALGRNATVAFKRT